VAVSSAVVNNGFDSVFLKPFIGPLQPNKYCKNTTACLQHKSQTGCHKTVL